MQRNENAGGARRADRRRAIRIGTGLAATLLLAAVAVGGGVHAMQMLQPSFTIAAPAAGATVSSPVQLRVTVHGATIGRPSAGLDHLHVAVDGGEAQPIYDRPALSLPLAPGRHTIAVDLAGPDHQPLTPPQSVSFFVR